MSEANEGPERSGFADPLSQKLAYLIVGLILVAGLFYPFLIDLFGVEETVFGSLYLRISIFGVILLLVGYVAVRERRKKGEDVEHTRMAITGLLRLAPFVFVGFAAYILLADGYNFILAYTESEEVASVATIVSFAVLYLLFRLSQRPRGNHAYGREENGDQGQ